MFNKFDTRLISAIRKLEVPLARTGIFVVYFWFGLLKLLGLSPAEQLVEALFLKTIGFMSFPTFYVLFALFEMAIGVIFLIKGLERPAMLLLFFHIVMTSLPLFLLPAITWRQFFVPTLEGQYIIKNILIVALAITIGAKLVPRESRGSGEKPAAF